MKMVLALRHSRDDDNRGGAEMIRLSLGALDASTVGNARGEQHLWQDLS